MPHRKKSIYSFLYTVLLIVLLAFFAHNCFEDIYYDVLQINQPIRLLGYSYVIEDIFPYYTPNPGEALDIQVYVYRFNFKVICFVLSLAVFQLVQTLNIFLQELPGRTFTKLPYFLLVLIGLFFYEFLDFIFFAGQSDWRYQALIVAVALICVRVTIK